MLDPQFFQSVIVEGGTQATVVEFLALALVGEINVNQDINQRLKGEWKTRGLRLDPWLLVLRIRTTHPRIVHPHLSDLSR
jgi:hypothetical protein